MNYINRSLPYSLYCFVSPLFFPFSFFFSFSKEFVADHKIEFHHVGQEVRPSLAGSGSSVSEEMVLSALGVVLDRTKYPLLIACNLGRHHTGTVVGCLRKLQRWNLTSIVEEYRRYAGSKVRLLNEQFIEFFDTELVSTPSISPAWL